MAPSATWPHVEIQESARGVGFVGARILQTELTRPGKVGDQPCKASPSPGGHAPHPRPAAPAPCCPAPGGARPLGRGSPPGCLPRGRGRRPPEAPPCVCLRVCVCLPAPFLPGKDSLWRPQKPIALSALAVPNTRRVPASVPEPLAPSREASADYIVTTLLWRGWWCAAPRPGNARWPIAVPERAGWVAEGVRPAPARGSLASVPARPPPAAAQSREGRMSPVGPRLQRLARREPEVEGEGACPSVKPPQRRRGEHGRAGRPQ